MSRLELRDLAASDLDALAALLCGRFSRLRAAEPELAPFASDARECRATLAELRSSPRCSGAVALLGDAPVGFVLGLRSLYAPDTAQAYFNPPFSVSIPPQAHACAPDADPLEVYRALYAYLAQRWVADGFLEHGVGLLAVERDAHEAWVTLGFGRNFTCGLRGVEPLPRAARADLAIRLAGEKDLADVEALLAEQRAFHARAPMFLPNLRVVHEAQRELARWAMTQPRSPTFLAARGGQVLGMLLFAPLGFVSWPLRDPGTAYLFQGVVRESARGGGIGSALLQHAFAWLRDAGVRRCALHYLSTNPSGSVFWPSHGFRPAEHFLHRRVDARIAWST